MLSADNVLTPDHYSLLCSDLYVFVFLFSIRFYVLRVSHFATYHTAVDDILCVYVCLSSDLCLVIWLWSLVLFYITRWICACTKRATIADDLLNWRRYLQTGKIIWIFPFLCFCFCFHWISVGIGIREQKNATISGVWTHSRNVKCNFKCESGLYSMQSHST